MHAGSAARRARQGLIAAVVCAGAGAAVSASSAMAVTTPSTISAVNDTTTPEQAVPVDLTFSGTNGTGAAADVLAVVRPAGGLACQSTYQEDISTLGGVDTTILSPGSQDAPAGSYTVNADFKPAAAGAYQLCAWLDGGTAASAGDDTLAGPTTVGITARGPQVPVFTVSVPSALTPNVPFQVSYTTQTDQQLNLFSLILAGAAPQTTCPANYNTASQQEVTSGTILGPGTVVFGGPTTTAATTTQKQGSYLICSWIEGPNVPEVDAALVTPVTVGTPNSTLPPKPGLKVGKVTASRRRGISVAGGASSKFAGKLSVLAACGRSSGKGSASAKKGKFSDHVRVPAGCKGAHSVKITVSWGGSKAWTKQSVSKSVAIKS
jgi:hypothetical protein